MDERDSFNQIDEKTINKDNEMFWSKKQKIIHVTSNSK